VAGVARIADSVPVEAEGRRSEEETRGWQVGGDARLMDIGTGLRETVTVAAVHDDETVTVSAADGRSGRVPASRLSPVGDYEPGTRPVSVTETSWRRALDELGVTSDRLEEPVSPLRPELWRDVAYRIARQLDEGRTAYPRPAGQPGAEQRATRAAALDLARGGGGLPAHNDGAPRTSRGPLAGTEPTRDPAPPGLDEALAVTTQPRQRITRLQRAGSADAAGLMPHEGQRR
jgi:hypothetical protein